MTKENYKYVDDNEHSHTISNKGLEKAIEYKLELQKTNGRANWNIICRWLRKDGFDAKKCEAFRLLVRNYQKKQGKLPSNKPYVADDTVTEYDKHLGELSLATRSEQNMKREFNKLKRSMVDNRLVDKEVQNTIRTALGNVDFNIVNTKKINAVKQGNSKDMVIAISDWHVGSRFNGVDYGFSYALLQKCVDEYLAKIEKRINDEKPHAVYVVSLGDLIENLYMRNQDQAFESEFDLATQETKIIELLSEFLTKIASFTNAPVYYTGIAGNHDRSNGNYRNNIYGDSFNKVLGAVINLLSKQVKNLHYIEPDNTYRTHLTINGVNIKIIHGDVDSIHDPNIIAKLGQRDGRLYQVLLLGHEHHYEVKEQNGLFYMIGSLKGADSYSDKLGLRAGRSQGFLWVDKDGTVEPEIVRIYAQ